MEDRKELAGKYALVELLARGGMGAVYRARHVALDVDVAVKLMSPLLASSPEQRARFAREARAAAQIRSPHVVQIHDHGVEGDVPYIVMELLAGEDLGARLRRETKLPLVETASILKQVTRGLRKAHEMGIVHRDLKPANIFLSRGDEDEPSVKILDFGIARATAGGDSTLTGEILGSPPYMSPEQARGLKNIDHRTDQWSLAAVVFRMLTGKLPFQAEHACDVLVKICTETAPLLSSITQDHPRALDAVFAKAFERDPEKRFRSIREFSEAFHFTALPPAPSRSPEREGSKVVFFPHVPVGRTTIRLSDVSRDSVSDSVSDMDPPSDSITTSPLAIRAEERPSRIIETAPVIGAGPSHVTEPLPMFGGRPSEPGDTVPLPEKELLRRTAPPSLSPSVVTPLPFVPAPRPIYPSETSSDVPTGSGAMTRPVSTRQPRAGSDVSLFKAGVFALCAFVGATAVWMVRTARQPVATDQIMRSVAVAAQPPAGAPSPQTATLPSATITASAPVPSAAPTASAVRPSTKRHSTAPRPTAGASAEPAKVLPSRVIYDDPE